MATTPSNKQKSIDWDSFNPFEFPSSSSTHGSPDAASTSTAASQNRWPRNCVIRLIVPAHQAGTIVGHRGGHINKITAETRANIQIFNAPAYTPFRLVFVYGREEPGASISPAMEALLAIFRYITGFQFGPFGTEHCAVKLLLSPVQASSLTAGSIETIRQQSGAHVYLWVAGRGPYFVGDDEKVIEIRGEKLKILNALERMGRHLRSHLVYNRAIPLFREKYNEMLLEYNRGQPRRDNASSFSGQQGTTRPAPQRPSVPSPRLGHNDAALVNPSWWDDDDAYRCRRGTCTHTLNRPVPQPSSSTSLSHTSSNWEDDDSSYRCRRGTCTHIRAPMNSQHRSPTSTDAARLTQVEPYNRSVRPTAYYQRRDPSSSSSNFRGNNRFRHQP